MPLQRSKSIESPVRPPGESFKHALSEGLRPPIDVTLAWEQHAEYCEALRAAGLDLIELPAGEEHPKACSVQDTDAILGGLAVITRFGVQSRQGEQDAGSRALRAGARTHRFQGPPLAPPPAAPRSGQGRSAIRDPGPQRLPWPEQDL